MRRRWGLASLYTLAYAAICLFWIEYWPLAAWASGVQPLQSHSTGGGYLIDRIAAVLSYVDWRNLGVFAENIVRFATWQNMLVAPLALLGAIAYDPDQGLHPPAGAGRMSDARGRLRRDAVPDPRLGLPLPAWSAGLDRARRRLGLGAAHRYARPAERKAAAAGALTLACIVSLLVLTPLRAWQAWDYVRPYATAYAAVQSANADVVVVDNIGSVLFDQGTLVRNDPFLANRPKVMELDRPHRCGRAHALRDAEAVGLQWPERQGRGAFDTVPWDGSAHDTDLRGLMMRPRLLPGDAPFGLTRRWLAPPDPDEGPAARRRGKAERQQQGEGERRSRRPDRLLP